MKMRYFYKNVEVEKKERDYIEKRVGKLEKLLEKVDLYEIEIDKDKKGMFRAEVMIKVPRKMYRAEETSESIGASIDIVVDELQTQIRRDKEKIRDIKERGARSIKKKLSLDKKARFR